MTRTVSRMHVDRAKVDQIHVDRMHVDRTQVLIACVSILWILARMHVDGPTKFLC